MSLRRQFPADYSLINGIYEKSYQHANKQRTGDDGRLLAGNEHIEERKLLNKWSERDI